MSTAAKPHSLAHDALAVLAGFGMLGFAYALYVAAHWLRFEIFPWEMM